MSTRCITVVCMPTTYILSSLYTILTVYYYYCPTVLPQAHLALVSAKEVEKQHALTLLRQELEEFVQTADQVRIQGI